MDDSPDSGEALPLLGEVYRLRGTGLFLLGPESPPLGLVIRDGQIAAFCPPPGPRPVPKKPLPQPGDSAELKLDRVLAEVGLRKQKASHPTSATTPREVGALRAKVVAAMANGAATATFEETTEVPRNAIPTTGAIETLILDALRATEDKDRVRDILGDTDQRLVATSALAKQKKTLTLTEGYLLSRVDGLLSTREILQLVPLQSDEAETTLAALLLTGRLKKEAAPRPQRNEEPRTVPAPSPATAAVPEPAEEIEEEEAPTAPKMTIDEDADEDEDDVPATGEEVASAAPSQSEDVEAEEPAFGESEPEEVQAEEPAPAPAEPATAQEPAAAATTQADDEGAELSSPEPVPMTPEQAAERQEILDAFQALSLRNHYEVLGVARRSSDADIKKAQVALVKRYHPDMRREPYLEDLHDVLEAIFIRVGEAWEVLRSPESRANYEQYLGRAPREEESNKESKKESEKESEKEREKERDAKAPGANEEPASQPRGHDPDETLRQAQVLLGTGRYWDAIQILETAMPQLESQQHQHAGRILLARAYSRNPKWVHRAVETLQEVLAEDPKSANAYYELGMVYKNGGLATRAEAMFRKALDANPRHKRAAAEFNEKEKEPASGGLLRRLFGGKG